MSAAALIDNRVKLLLVVLVGLCYLGPMHGSAKDASIELNFIEVAPGNFVHFGRHEEMSVTNGGNIANIGFIVGEHSIAVIDPGGSPAVGQRMRELIHATSDLPISHVILTHIHPDHIFGGSAFVDVPNVVAHVNFTQALTQRGAFYRDAFSELFPREELLTSLLPTIDTFEVLKIDLGNRILRIRQHAIAHTNNDVSVFDEKTESLWASDLVFAERVPSLDGSLPGWIKVLDELQELKPNLVIPGHGEAGDWRTLMAPQQQYLQKVLVHTRQAIQENKRLAEAVEFVAADERHNWALFGQQHRGNVTKAFTELEWE